MSGMMKVLDIIKSVLLGNSMDTGVEKELSKGDKKLKSLQRSYSSMVWGDVSPTPSKTCKNTSPF